MTYGALRLAVLSALDRPGYGLGHQLTHADVQALMAVIADVAADIERDSNQDFAKRRTLPTSRPIRESR